MLFPHNTPTQKPKTLNIVPSSMSMLMSNSLGMPVSLCGGSSFFGIFSKMFSADLSLFSSSSASALCVLLKGLRRKRRALFLFVVVERFDLRGGKGRRFDFPFWFRCEETTTHDAHVVGIIVVVAFVVVPLSPSLLFSLCVCFLRVTCALSCCAPPPRLASVFSFLSRWWRNTAALSFFVAEKCDGSIEGRYVCFLWRSINTVI